MKIILSPQRRSDELIVRKSGDKLLVNHTSFDFEPIGEGDTLPYGAVDSIWFPGDISRMNGELVLTLLFPIPENYSQEQAFPVPLLTVPDGVVVFPGPDQVNFVPPQPDPSAPVTEGVIDWTKLITQEMKDAAVLAAQLATRKSELAERNARAATQIARIQDRIDTLGYGIEIGEVTPEEEAEQAALAAPLKAWKTYKYALGKVTTQPGWFESPVWPVEPPVPEIVASPMLLNAETI
ncbi:hypothetical protein SAMN05428955_3470 [Pseudomonas sp. 7SR1]|nr:hypothetical protein SAMN05428955_3470 [Pseudomonas sp. 7SR1]